MTAIIRLRRLFFTAFATFLAAATLTKSQDPCSFSYPHRCTQSPQVDGAASECLYSASWDHNTRTDLVTFDVSIKNPEGDRWLAIAFSNDRLMPRSDVIIGWIERLPVVDAALLSDRYIFGYLEPIVDKEQDAQLITWSSTDGRTSIRFTRPRITFDQRDVNLTSASPCPYFFFTHDPGTVDSRGIISQHRDPPIIYGPVCMSTCSAYNYVLRRGDCRRHSHVPVPGSSSEEGSKTESVDTEHLFSANQISFADCKQKCDFNPECMSFTYLADGSACYLLRSSCLAKDFNPTVANTYHYEKMDIPGFSNSRSDACITHHHENVRILSMSTLAECAKACEETSKCPGFSYQPSDTRCYLHSTTCSPNPYPSKDPLRAPPQNIGSVDQPETYAFIKLASTCEISDILVMMAFTQETMTPDGLNSVVDFLVQLVSRLDIDSDVIKFAYTLWGEDAPSRVADFQGEFDREQLLASINLISYADLPQSTVQVASMFQFAYSHAFVPSVVRPTAKHTIIFLTSTSYEEGNIDAAVYEASQALKRNIRIVAVGLGQFPLEHQLSAIVNNSANNIYFDGDLNHLNRLSCQLSNLHCSYKECAAGYSPATEPPTSTEPTTEQPTEPPIFEPERSIQTFPSSSEEELMSRGEVGEISETASQSVEENLFEPETTTSTETTTTTTLITEKATDPTVENELETSTESTSTTSSANLTTETMSAEDNEPESLEDLAEKDETYAAKMQLPESSQLDHLFPNMDCPMSACSEGYVFYAVFMSNIQPDVVTDLELFVALSATNKANIIAAVEIDSHYFRDRLFVHGGQMGRVLLPRSAFEMPLTGSASLHTKGLKISSNASITVFTINRQGFSSDAAVIFPEEGLGSEYLTVSYYPSDHFTQFGILSPHNSNLVSITLPPRDEGILDSITEKLNKGHQRINCTLRYGGETFVNGDTLTIRMNYLETFQLQSTCDLSGTAIRSRKPIAVFSGNVLTSVSNVIYGGYGSPNPAQSGRFQSHLVDQVPPVSRLGRLYAAVSAPRRLTGDSWAIVAPFDNTELSIYSNDRSTIEVATRFLHFGQKFEFTSVNDMHFLIASTKPVLVAQFVKSEQLGSAYGRGSSPSMVIYPPMEQWAKRYTFLVPYGYKQAYKNYLIVTVRKGHEDGILLNGESAQLPTDAAWLPINGSPDLVSAFIPVSEGVHTVYHEQWFDLRFGALVYSTGPNGSLYYSAGQCLANLNCEPTLAEANDLVDNDCDGFIDEELYNNRDDDADGRTDEDIYEVVARPQDEFKSTEAPEPPIPTEEPITDTTRRLIKVEMEKPLQMTTTETTVRFHVSERTTKFPETTTTTSFTTSQVPWLISFIGTDGPSVLPMNATTQMPRQPPIYLTISGWKGTATKKPTMAPVRHTYRKPSEITKPPRRPVAPPFRRPSPPHRKPGSSHRKQPTTPRPTLVDSFHAPFRADLKLHHVCFGDTLSITCPKASTAIVIVSAHFGRINYWREVTCASENPTTCGGRIEDSCGYADAFFVLDEVCEGRQTCSLPVDGNLLRRIPNNSTCDVCQMYFTYAYFCRDNRENTTDCSTMSSINRYAVTYAQGNYAYKKGYEVDFSFEAIEAGMKVITKPNCTAPSLNPNKNTSALVPSLKQEEASCSKDDDFHRNQYFSPPNPKLCNMSESSMQAADMLAWCPPYTCSAGCLPYLEIDLHGYYKISGIVLQGRRKWDAWISEFRIEHSFDGKAFNALARIFTGPKNTRDIVFWRFNSLSFVARFIRVVVTRYHGYPAGHVDIIRCRYFEPVGCRPISVPHSSLKREPLLRNRHLEARCEDGWMTANNQTKFTIRCASNLYWHGVQPCEKLRTCGDIPAVSGALHNGTSVMVGSTVQYTCAKKGAHLVGSSVVTCKDDARWSQEPVCVEAK